MTAVTSRYPIVIDAGASRPLFGVSEIWRYRDLVRLLAARDVKLRFRQTRLGAIWLVVSPLFFTVGYAFLFGSIGNVKTGGTNDFVYTYVGMSLWTAFSSVFFRTCNCLLGNKDLLTHVYFPRLSIPIASVVSTQIDVLISWTILTASLVAVGDGLSPTLLLIPIWFALIQLIAGSLGLIVASFSVTFRDLQNVTSLVIALGPVFTPVAYPASALPHNFRWLATANPLTPLFDAMRACALGAQWPSALGFVYTTATVVVLVCVSCMIFRRAERRLADVI